MARMSSPTLTDKIRRLCNDKSYRSRVLYTRFQDFGYGSLFRLGLSQAGALHLGYHPDAHYVFRNFPEFKKLRRKFTRSNPHHRGDLARLWAIMLNCKQVINEGIPGDFAELGVWRGNSAAVLAHYAAGAERELFLFDTYEGFDAGDLTGVDSSQNVQFNNTSMEAVQRNIGEDAQGVHLVKGFFPNSIQPTHRDRQYAIVNLDCDLYEPMKAGLEFFYPRMSRGEIFMIHDYSNPHWDGPKLALDEFCRQHGEHLVVLPDKDGSAFLRKYSGH